MLHFTAINLYFDFVFQRSHYPCYFLVILPPAHLPGICFSNYACLWRGVERNFDLRLNNYSVTGRELILGRTNGLRNRSWSWGNLINTDQCVVHQWVNKYMGYLNLFKISDLITEGKKNRPHLMDVEWLNIQDLCTTIFQLNFTSSSPSLPHFLYALASTHTQRWNSILCRAIRTLMAVPGLCRKSK